MIKTTNLCQSSMVSTLKWIFGEFLFFPPPYQCSNLLNFSNIVASPSSIFCQRIDVVVVYPFPMFPPHRWPKKLSFVEVSTVRTTKICRYFRYLEKIDKKFLLVSSFPLLCQLFNQLILADILALSSYSFHQCHRKPFHLNAPMFRWSSANGFRRFFTPFSIR